MGCAQKFSFNFLSNFFMLKKVCFKISLFFESRILSFMKAPNLTNDQRASFNLIFLLFSMDKDFDNFAKKEKLGDQAKIMSPWIKKIVIWDTWRLDFMKTRNFNFYRAFFYGRFLGDKSIFHIFQFSCLKINVESWKGNEKLKALESFFK